MVGRFVGQARFYIYFAIFNHFCRRPIAQKVIQAQTLFVANCIATAISVPSVINFIWVQRAPCVNPARVQPFVHKGNAAGFKSGSFQLGASGAPVKLFKTSDACTAGSGTYKNVAPDYVVSCINALNEMPGGLDTKPFVIIPVAVANVLQTSEIKRADWMGDAESALRKSVRFLGELNGANIIVDNQLPMWRADGSNPAEYLIFFGDTSAITFADEARVKNKLDSVEEWGEFHRSKMIYDWFVRYPERIGCGYVTIG